MPSVILTFFCILKILFADKSWLTKQIIHVVNETSCVLTQQSAESGWPAQLEFETKTFLVLVQKVLEGVLTWPNSSLPS